MTLEQELVLLQVDISAMQQQMAELLVQVEKLQERLEAAHEHVADLGRRQRKPYELPKWEEALMQGCDRQLEPDWAGQGKVHLPDCNLCGKPAMFLDRQRQRALCQDCYQYEYRSPLPSRTASQMRDSQRLDARITRPARRTWDTMFSAAVLLLSVCFYLALFAPYLIRIAEKLFGDLAGVL